MKKAYRDHVLKGMFADLASKDFDLRENALFQLALMLQRTNSSSAGPEMLLRHEESLSREQLRIRLSDSEQRQIVDNLLRLVATRKESRASAFWTLAEVRADICLEPALALIQATGHQLNHEASYQVCQALRRWLTSEQMDKAHLAQRLARQDPSRVLKRWSESADDRLASRALSVIDTLQRMMR